jgi:hypothetical protein
MADKLSEQPRFPLSREGVAARVWREAADQEQRG